MTRPGKYIDPDGRAWSAPDYNADGSFDGVLSWNEFLYDGQTARVSGISDPTYQSWLGTQNRRWHESFMESIRNLAR
jgi:hypothetical protein